MLIFSWKNSTTYRFDMRQSLSILNFDYLQMGLDVGLQSDNDGNELFLLCFSLINRHQGSLISIQPTSALYSWIEIKFQL